MTPGTQATRVPLFDDLIGALGLGVGCWEMGGLGLWALGVGHWKLGIGRWAFGVGAWALGFGSWVWAVGKRGLGVGPLAVGIPKGSLLAG